MFTRLHAAVTPETYSSFLGHRALNSVMVIFVPMSTDGFEAWLPVSRVSHLVEAVTSGQEKDVADQ